MIFHINSFTNFLEKYLNGSLEYPVNFSTRKTHFHDISQWRAFPYLKYEVSIWITIRFSQHLQCCYFSEDYITFTFVEILEHIIFFHWCEIDLFSRETIWYLDTSLFYMWQKVNQMHTMSKGEAEKATFLAYMIHIWFIPLEWKTANL